MNRETGEAVHICAACVGTAIGSDLTTDPRLGIFELADTFRR